jgi:ABC-type nitrate/sulfonate/bicarbonate transport system permease component
MNYFLAGFACGFTLGFLLAAIIAILLGVLAVLSLTMDASDLPKGLLRSASKKLSL